MSIESVISNQNVTDAPLRQETEKVFYPESNQKKLAIKDVLESFQKWRIWTMLSYQDIKLRYRRSILGPFWITLSMAITVYSMGYLYGHLFHSNLATYFPFLVGGMLSWALVSICITELSEGFSVSDAMIKQIKLPYSVYVHRIISRNIIIFFHNLVVIIPILAIYHESAKVNWNTLLLIPNLLIFYVNAFTYGLVLALIGARYRDISQIIKSLIQVAFFVTPVMWNPSLLPPKDHLLVVLNPFYAFVELMRAPMIGMAPTLSVYVMATIVTIGGIVLCSKMFSKYRARIVYWL
jgi:ABC-type polysaccharide/polyol phosphate export permease